MLVGQYIYCRLTDEGREGLRRAASVPEDEPDSLHGMLGDVGFSVGCGREPVTEEDLVRLLDIVAVARLKFPSHGDYVCVLQELSEGTGVPRLVALYEEATGILDADVFDEILDPDEGGELSGRGDLGRHFRAQHDELRRRGHPGVPRRQAAVARAGLHHLPPGDPAFETPRQLLLPHIRGQRLVKP